MKSPPWGCSTLMTSAPCSPSSPAQNGAEIRVPTSTTRTPSRGPLTAGGSPGEAQHPLAHDVALDLVGAGEDRRRLVVEPGALPAPVARVVGRAPPQRRRLAQHHHGGVVQALGHLAPVELE